MIINRQNYEEYFVRYLDGELSSQEVAEVKFFLQQYPELNAELNAFRATLLSDGEVISFPKKEFLKRGITTTNYEEHFVRYVENDLSAEEGIDLREFVREHPELQREFNAFEATKLVADTSIAFPDKSLLKRREPRVVPLYVRYAAAIAVAAGLMLIVIFRTVNQSAVHNTLSQTLPATEQSNAAGDAKTIAGSNASPVSSNQLPAEYVASSNENKNRGIKNSSSATASLHHSNVSSTLVAATQSTIEEMPLIETRVEPINFQRKFRKAHYLTSTVSSEVKNSSSQNASPLKFSSLASSLAIELLRLSGREEYLKTSSAFNSSQEEKKKLPLTLNIAGKKFDLHHTFFKKRNRSASSSNKN